MRSATSSTRSVMITRSLCPRTSRACCAKCTLIVPSSPKLALLGREDSHCTSCAQRIVNPQLEPPKIQLLDFLYGEWGDQDNHALFTLPNQPLKGGIRDSGGRTRPGHH